MKRATPEAGTRSGCGAMPSAEPLVADIPRLRPCLLDEERGTVEQAAPRPVCYATSF